LPHPAVLLAEPHLVVPPQIQLYVPGQMPGGIGKSLGEVF